MRWRNLSIFTVVVAVMACAGCAKQADPKRSIEKIQKEVVTMSVQDLESHAAAYAAAIRAQKAEIMKIQDKVQKLPVEKFFNNKALTQRIAAIGREAEAYFERYRIYVKALEEKGGDLGKVQIEPPQT